MSTSYVVPLLCAAAIAFACGGPHRGATELAAAAQQQRPDSGASALASSLDVTVGDGVGLALHVTNASEKRVELNFPSGQMYDFAVRDASGREVWRWSADRMFTQSLRNRLLDAGETVTFEERWRGGAQAPAGAYVAVATLRSNDHPLETRLDFTLP